MKKITIKVPYDYVMGYLRHGHLECDLEFEDDEDFQKFKNNPQQYLIDKEENDNEDFYIYDGDFVLDDYRLEDTGELEFNRLTWKEK